MAGRCPMQREQSLQLADRRAGNASEDVGEPCPRVDAVELGGHNQRGHKGAAVSRDPTGEEPGLPAESKGSQGPLGSIVRQENPAERALRLSMYRSPRRPENCMTDLPARPASNPRVLRRAAGYPSVDDFQRWSWKGRISDFILQPRDISPSGNPAKTASAYCRGG